MTGGGGSSDWYGSILIPGELREWRLNMVGILVSRLRFLLDLDSLPLVSLFPKQGVDCYSFESNSRSTWEVKGQAFNWMKRRADMSGDGKTGKLVKWFTGCTHWREPLQAKRGADGLEEQENKDTDSTSLLTLRRGTSSTWKGWRGNSDLIWYPGES